MSGHSKWSSIKHQKGVADARRGQLFTKLTREIIVAVRQGGASPDSNFRLRIAIQKARDSNMPMDNIERSIKKGSGESEGASLVEITFEGYGPHGVAVLVEAMTDNRNRTVQEVRSVFSRHGGNLGESGSVAWNFENKGVITVGTDGVDAEGLSLLAIDAGAEDVIEGTGYLEIIATPQDLEAVRQAVEQKKAVASAEVSLVPKSTVTLGEKESLQVIKLLNHLEELDDVQRVSSIVDFSDAVIEKSQSGA